jgi:hypothetical protein
MNDRNPIHCQTIFHSSYFPIMSRFRQANAQYNARCKTSSVDKKSSTTSNIVPDTEKLTILANQKRNEILHAENQIQSFLESLHKKDARYVPQHKIVKEHIAGENSQALNTTFKALKHRLASLRTELNNIRIKLGEIKPPEIQVNIIQEEENQRQLLRNQATYIIERRMVGILAAMEGIRCYHWNKQKENTDQNQDQDNIMKSVPCDCIKKAPGIFEINQQNHQPGTYFLDDALVQRQIRVFNAMGTTLCANPGGFGQPISPSDHIALIQQLENKQQS